MKLLGVIVLYYPPQSLYKNISTYIDSVVELIIWDNTPEKYNMGFLSTLSNKIVYMGEGKNKGIGYALNRATEYALEHNFTHLLTLDQDSFFKTGIFSDYLNEIKNYGEKNEVIFSTNYYIISRKETYYPVVDEIIEVTSCMTSGSIYPISLLSKLGNFREDLFVWGIDMEFCWRAKKYGYSTICFKNILLIHHFGNQKKKRKLLGREVFPNEYSSARTYYNIRNGIILNKEYPEFLNLKAHLRYHLYKRIIFIILYESGKIKKLIALFHGYLDGKRKRKGQYNP